jgi:hypothetical protein
MRKGKYMVSKGIQVDVYHLNYLVHKAMNSISAIWHWRWIATHSSGESVLLLGSFIVLLWLLAAASLTYFAIYKIRPESFKIGASVTKHTTFSLEIRSSQQLANSTAKEKIDSADGLRAVNTEEVDLCAIH